MQSFMLSSKSAQLIEYMDLRTRPIHMLLWATLVGGRVKTCHSLTSLIEPVVVMS